MTELFCFTTHFFSLLVVVLDLCPRSEPLPLADAWGKVIERDIVDRPESVLVLTVGQKNIVILIEEYDLGAGAWPLTLPAEKVTTLHLRGYCTRRKPN